MHVAVQNVKSPYLLITNRCLGFPHLLKFAVESSAQEKDDYKKAPGSPACSCSNHRKDARLPCP